MTDDKENKDFLDKLLVDEDSDSVQERLDNFDENKVNPWDKASSQENSNPIIKKNKKNIASKFSAYKNFFILIIIIGAALGFIIYSQDINTSKDIKYITKKNLISIDSDYFKIENMGWINSYSDYKFKIINKSNQYIAKEIIFQYGLKSEPNCNISSDSTTKKILTKIETNQTKIITFKNVDIPSGKDWCYSLEFKGYIK